MNRLAVALVAVALVVSGCTARAGGRPRASGRASASASPSGPRTFTIVGAGDVLVHPPVWQQAQADARAEGRTGMDFGPIFAGVKPVVSAADLGICHLETPVSAPNGPYVGWPRFSAPPQVLTGVRETGFDDCSTASNHSYDDGVAGVDRTVNALDRAGLHHSGTAETARQAATPNVFTMHGVTVAELSYTFGLNSGLSLPADKPWLVNVTEVDKVLAAAHSAREAGAQIVVLSLHWGTEYQEAPTALQVSQARALLASPDVDLILGCHVHVVQPFEKINGKWVVYGMGNEIARHEDPIDASREGVMPRVTFTEVAPGHWKATAVQAIPTWVDISPKIRLVDLAGALASSNLDAATRTTYRTAYDRIVTAVRSRGATVGVPVS